MQTKNCYGLPGMVKENMRVAFEWTTEERERLQEKDHYFRLRQHE